MAQGSPSLSASRAVRVVHLAILGGLAVIAMAFSVLVQIRQPVRPDLALLGPVMAAAAGAILIVALAALRPRVRGRRANQPPDAYWADPVNRSAALILWMALEGAGMLAALGYLMTGSAAPAVVGALTVVALIGLGPARLEGER